MRPQNPRGPGQGLTRCRSDVRQDGCPDRSRKTSPMIFVEGNAGTDLDRAGADVAPIDVPAFLRRIGTTAAGEGGHAALKRSQRAAANRPPDWCEAG
jgi:hypothetical protein